MMVRFSVWDSEFKRVGNNETFLVLQYNIPFPSVLKHLKERKGKLSVKESRNELMTAFGNTSRLLFHTDTGPTIVCNMQCKIACNINMLIAIV